LYLLTVSVAALFFRAPRAIRQPTARLIVLVPAHDESALIARCVRSLRDQTYPRSLYRVVVVADNCTDDTAARAAEAGADLVLERLAPGARGKGRALRWAMDRMMAADPAAEAFAVVDADSVADREFLSMLVVPLEAGARAVQGESLLEPGGQGVGGLRMSAFLLINRVRPAGRAVLRLPMTHLAGNGMLLTRELLLQKPWEAYTSAEDLEYSLDLQVDGIAIVYASGAVLLSPPAPNGEAAAKQQLRWEGGKFHLARTRLPRLVARAVRDRRPALLGVAFDLAVPPIGWLAAAALAGSLVAAGVVAVTSVPLWTLTPWLVGLCAIPLSVLVGLRAAGAPRSAYRALLRAPLLVLTKPLGAATLLRFRGDTWVRTERSAPPSRPEGET
jgi:cellulose synthase/poly-beta-1,6-N-acetylglucosamine synthase-like glycosyltransferase